MSRGVAAGLHAEGAGTAGWLNRLHGGRTRTELLGESPADDVADPIGSPRESYERTAIEIDELLDRVVELAFRRQAA